MATKLNDRPPKTGNRRTSDSKRIKFERGQAKTNGDGLPLKTSDVTSDRTPK